MEVSVFVITYNHAQFIEQTLNSIIEQKTNFEFDIVIGDDCSIDGTRDILISFQLKYPEKVKLILNEHNLGAQANQENTLNQCNGKYIAVLEGDDYWINNDKLQTQYDFLENNLKFAIHCGRAIIEASDSNPLNGKFIHEDHQIKQELELEDFIIDSPISTCTVMFRNIRFANYPETFKSARAGDWFIWIYLLENTMAKVYYSKEIFAKYRIHETGAFSGLNEFSQLKYYKENLRIIQTHFSSIKEFNSKIQTKLREINSLMFRHLIDDREFWKAFVFFIRNLRELPKNRKQLLLELKDNAFRK